MAIRIGDAGSNVFGLTTSQAYNYGLEDDRGVGLEGNDTILTGAGNDFLDGGDDDDHLYDGDGNDTVIAGAGKDTIYVDAGNDIYYNSGGVDLLNFSLIHVGMNGYEESYVGIKLDLASTAPQDLGQLGVDRFFGFENVVTGYGSDTISGSAGANSIGSLGGNDILNGRAGNDTIVGGIGADTLIGGLGKDLIAIADPVDSFRDVVGYESLKDSGTTDATRDTISSFTKGQDKIDLSQIDANLSLKGNQAFKVVKGFTKAFGEIKLVKSGADTIVQVDGDKDKAVDMTFIVFGAHLTKGDFIL